MGSSRFPGKMMTVVAGRPLIEHVFLRLKTLDGMRVGSFSLGPLVLATSDTPQDRLMAEHLRLAVPQVNLLFGSENDVLSRFLKVIEETGCLHLVRVTGDCPLINAEDLPSKIESHIACDADATNYQPGYEYVDKGVEVVSARALRETARNPRTEVFHREHVTAFIYENPGLFRINYVEAKPIFRRADVRLTVDEPKDAKFYDAFHRSIRRDLSELSLEEALRFLDRHPEIVAINQQAGRKSALFEPARILYRCDGGTQLGMGHVVGCIRFARLMASELHFGAEFMIRENPAVAAFIRKNGFERVTIPEGSTPSDQIKAIRDHQKVTRFSAVLFNFNAAELSAWGERFEELKDCTKVFFMDNPTSSYRTGDFVFNPLSHPDFAGYDPARHPACFDGLEYMLFDPPLLERMGRVREVRPDVERVLVAMGGGDYLDITSRVLRALADLGCRAFIDIVLGPLCPHAEAVGRLAQDLNLNAELSVNVSDLPERIWAADAGFSALGLTTYEMAALGLSCLIVTQSDFNANVASIYSRRYSMSVAVGASGNLSDAELRSATDRFLRDHEFRREVARRSLAVFQDSGRLRSVVEAVRRILAPSSS